MDRGHRDDYPWPMQSWEDQKLGELRPRYPHWDIWFVRMAPERRTLWCARPKGTEVSTVREESAGQLIAVLDRIGSLAG